MCCQWEFLPIPFRRFSCARPAFENVLIFHTSPRSSTSFIPPTMIESDLLSSPPNVVTFGDPVSRGQCALSLPGPRLPAFSLYSAFFPLASFSAFGTDSDPMAPGFSYLALHDFPFCLILLSCLPRLHPTHCCMRAPIPRFGPFFMRSTAFFLLPRPREALFLLHPMLDFSVVVEVTLPPLTTFCVFFPLPSLRS